MDTATRIVEKDEKTIGAKLYFGGEGNNVHRWLLSAYKTNYNRDAGERKIGWAAPEDGGHSMHLRTAISAIASGLSTMQIGEPPNDTEASCGGGLAGSLSCIAEGLAMVIKCEARIRAETGDPGQ